MTDKELIRRALMGDQEAQQECTRQGIVLPCPICGKESCIDILDCYTAEGLDCECQIYRKESFKCVCNFLKGGCGTSIGVSKTKQEALEKWNTRPAQPVGRCKDCINATNPGSNIVFCDYFERDMMPDDFCSCFEPKED